MAELTGHGGQLAVAAARAHGVQTMFTLSGAHVFPLYDAAVKPQPSVRLVDVRHEQSAVFAAEATAKLTRTPGLAVLTAGPGVTNGVSAVTTAHFNGSPVLVLGGRAPQARWGSGSLQELDHPPLLAPVTKHAATVREVGMIAAAVHDGLRIAGEPHRGPVFLDVPMDQLFSHGTAVLPEAPDRPPAEPDGDELARIGELLARASRPVLVIGSDVWADGAEEAALRFVQDLGIPTLTNGMGRGILPAGHPLLVTRARSKAFKEADLVIVAGTPLDFRLGYGVFGPKDSPAQVVHLADSAGQVSRHATLAASAHGDLTLVLDGLAAAWSSAGGSRGSGDAGGSGGSGGPGSSAGTGGSGRSYAGSGRSGGSGRSYAGWVAALRETADAAVAADGPILDSDADPIHPARVYRELTRQLADDAVIIGDGGDFVSFAGKFVEPRRPGCWLDPGPYGCLGTGLGYAIAARIARPSSQVVLLLGDGAAGFSLMDVDTLVRHGLPVVMVVGNNGIWGLEKHPMQFLYGYDVAAQLRPQTRYDEVVRALGGAGELVTRPGELDAALKRGFDSGVPYLVNVVTDPAVMYPRTTTGV